MTSADRRVRIGKSTSIDLSDKIRYMRFSLAGPRSVRAESLPQEDLRAAGRSRHNVILEGCR